MAWVALHQRLLHLILITLLEYLVSKLFLVLAALLGKLLLLFLPHELLFAFLRLLAVAEGVPLHDGDQHAHTCSRRLKDGESQSIHDGENTPHGWCTPESTPEDHAVLEKDVDLGARLVPPAFVALVIDNKPPTHLDQFAANYVLDHPEVNGT